MVLSDSDSEDDTAELSDKTRLLARNTSAFSAAVSVRNLQARYILHMYTM